MHSKANMWRVGEDLSFSQYSMWTNRFDLVSIRRTNTITTRCENGKNEREKNEKCIRIHVLEIDGSTPFDKSILTMATFFL